MKKLLLIIDCQNDFINGSLAVPNAEKMIGSLATYLSKSWKREYTDFVFTADWHPIKHSSFVENGGAWPSHCVKFTEGAAIHPSLTSILKVNNINYSILTKGLNEDTEEYSILANEASKKILLEIIEQNKIDQIDICGIAGDFCVKNTVMDLVKEGYKDKINVLLPYVADFDNSEFIPYLNKEKIKYE